MTIALAPAHNACVEIDEPYADLDLYDDHTNQAKALEAALIAGEQSGEPYPIDFAAFKARMRAEYARA